MQCDSCIGRMYVRELYQYAQMFPSRHGNCNVCIGSGLESNSIKTPKRINAYRQIWSRCYTLLFNHDFFLNPDPIPDDRFKPSSKGTRKHLG